MSENATLRIHTQMPPGTPSEAEKPKKEKKRKPRDRPRVRTRLSAGDRLLRNSAIACAFLLGVLTLGNLNQPWAEKASEGIERALTMRINLDDNLGELTFVRQIMPESALVFLNVSGGSEMTRPTDAALSHPWTALQPWLMFEADEGPIYAAGAGAVSAVSALSDGEYGLLIDHGDGIESVYAGLGEVTVQSGDSVSRGQALGSGKGSLYYELRQDGEAVDPSERLGL